MNKIKVIYDVVKKMKGKDLIKGILTAEGIKDQVKVFDMNNSFEKNIQSGQIKGETNIESNCNGKKMRLKNSIDFETECCSEHGNHCFMEHIHSFHSRNHEHPRSIKEGLGRLMTVLGILSSITLDEKEDKSVILSLNSDDIPEETKLAICEKMHECNCCKDADSIHQNHSFIKEFHSMENKSFTFNMFINKDSEIEKAIIEANGDQNDEGHNMKLTAQLCLEY